MTTMNWRRSALALTLVLSTVWATAPAVWTQDAEIDPAAVQTLKRMTDYVAGLQKFSMYAQNTLEDLLVTGQRIDLDVATNVLVRRPNKIHVSRVGELIDQDFYYDGKSLTLYNASHGIYATQPAPATIEEMLDYAREELGLMTPASDLVYRNAFDILMRDVTSAGVVGQAVIAGTACTHLIFSRPDVDLQVWVAEGDRSLPCKYVVTDKSTPELVSTVTVMSDWNLSPVAADAEFEFAPPEGVTATTFIPAE
jgi:hypothetical protein